MRIKIWRRRVTADSALRFAKYFGTSAKFWLGLQDDFDLEEEGKNKKSELDEIPKFNTNAAYNSFAAWLFPAFSPRIKRHPHVKYFD
jgi:plasmid maintenance system antidote protein VapI